MAPGLLTAVQRSLPLRHVRFAPVVLSVIAIVTDSVPRARPVPHAAAEPLGDRARPVVELGVPVPSARNAPRADSRVRGKVSPPDAKASSRDSVRISPPSHVV
jgi:hypothetical protein